MSAIDYIEFSKKATEHGLVYEHVTIPTFTLAAYFERLLNVNHPEHGDMLELAQQIDARARAEKIRIGQEQMRQARAAMSEDEWRMIVD